MKRLLLILLCAALAAFGLTGCSRKSASPDGNAGDAATAAPDDGGLAKIFAQEAETDALEDAQDVPAETPNPLPYTIIDQSSYALETPDDQQGEPSGDAEAEAEPVPTPTSAAAYAASLYQTSAYSLATLADTSFGFTFSYPSTWKNLPGKSTVCFEADDGSEFPARVAVTRKTLIHTPTDETIFKQFQSFAQVVYKQYDPDTFEYSTVNNRAVFMGRAAYEVSYMAYAGDVEVQGYIICCAIEKSMYVFHFCASYDDYRTLNPVMVRMRESCAVIGAEEEEEEG